MINDVIGTLIDALLRGVLCSERDAVGAMGFRLATVYLNQKSVYLEGKTAYLEHKKCVIWGQYFNFPANPAPDGRTKTETILLFFIALRKTAIELHQYSAEIRHFFRRNVCVAQTSGHRVDDLAKRR